LVPQGREITGLPALYLLHGYGGNRSSWRRQTRLAEYAAEHNLVIVAPESGRRWFINDHEGRRYADYLVEELIPATEERFGTVPSRFGRAIGGYSMGGAAALFLALAHPELFSVVISHAGAFEAPMRRGDPYAAHRTDPAFMMPTVADHEKVWGPPDSPTRRRYDPYRLLDRHDRALSLSLYLDIGVGDHARMVRMNRNVRAAVERTGTTLEYLERPGGHDWTFVDQGLVRSLAFAARRLTQPVSLR
jgi:S-formylglutathione hydrolase FrmB